MAQQKQVRTTTKVTWADAINNDANWTSSWTITEYVCIAVADLDLPFKTDAVGLRIEDIVFTGTGSTPATADKADAQILIALDSAFTNVVSFDTGLMSDGKYDTTVCVAAFHPQQNIVVTRGDTLYFTVKCANTAALLASSCRLIVSQE